MKKLSEVLEELKCENYYIVELDGNTKDIDDCLEYYTSADEIDPDLYEADVVDYDLVSHDFAAIYLDVTDLNETVDDMFEEIDRYCCKNDVKIFIDSIRNIHGWVEKPTKITIKLDPDEDVFTVEIDGKEATFDVYE